MSKYIDGVDFCHYQKKVDHSKLRAYGIEFAFFKAGEIPTKNKKEFDDDMYVRNIRESKEHGIINGAYYFYHPVIGASWQARHFDRLMKTCPYGMPNLPPVIDVEHKDGVKPADFKNQLTAMIQEMAELGYEELIIYSRWGFLVNDVGNPDWLLKGHDYTKRDGTKVHIKIWLWLAQYNTKLTNKPADMSNVIAWQNTDRLRIPGIGLNLDGNKWLQSEALLHKLAGLDDWEYQDASYSTEYTSEPYKRALITLRNTRTEDGVNIWNRMTNAWAKIRNL